MDAITVAQAVYRIKSPYLPFCFWNFWLEKRTCIMALAEECLMMKRQLIRFDMSEYKQKGDITKMIGDRQTRTKDNWLRRLNKNLIALFDRWGGESTFRSCRFIFAVLDAGRLTDSTGRQVSFKNTIVIITTNIGSEKLLSNMNWRKF